MSLEEKGVKILLEEETIRVVGIPHQTNTDLHPNHFDAISIITDKTTYSIHGCSHCQAMSFKELKL